MITATDRNAASIYNHFASRAGVATLESTYQGEFSDDVDFSKLASEVCALSMFKKKNNSDTTRAKYKNVVSGSCETLQEILDFYSEAANLVGNKAAGIDIQKRFESQVKTWFINYPERLRNKKVIVLKSAEPLVALGGYITDIIRMISARFLVDEFEYQLQPSDLQSWDPEVCVLANFDQSRRALVELRKAPLENLRAFKRGAVYWIRSNKVSPFDISPDNLFLLAGCLTSCIGDLDAGYICPKGLFYKLAYLEMFGNKIDLD